MTVHSNTPMNEPSHAGLHNFIEDKITEYGKAIDAHSHAGLAKDDHTHPEYEGGGEAGPHDHPEYGSAEQVAENKEQVETNRLNLLRVQGQVNAVQEDLDDLKTQVGAILEPVTETTQYLFKGDNQFTSAPGTFTAFTEMNKITAFLIHRKDAANQSVDLASVGPGDVLYFQIPETAPKTEEAEPRAQEPVVHTWVVERSEQEGDLYRIYVANRAKNPFTYGEQYELQIHHKTSRETSGEIDDLREQVALLTEAVEALSGRMDTHTHGGGPLTITVKKAADNEPEPGEYYPYVDYLYLNLQDWERIKDQVRLGMTCEQRGERDKDWIGLTEVTFYEFANKVKVPFSSYNGGNPSGTGVEVTLTFKDPQ